LCGRAAQAQRSTAFLFGSIQMIRHLTAVATLMAATVFTHAQEIPSPARLWCLYCRPAESMTGPVRSVLAVEKREEYPFGITVDIYNPQRKRIESMSHSSNREVHSGQIVRLDSRYLHIYDPQGRLIKEVGCALEHPERTYDTVTYKYDANSRLIEETVLSGGKPFLKTSFSYEPAKRTVTALTTTYVEDRVVGPDKAVLVYNENGQWIKRTIYRSNGPLNAIAEFLYDERGNLARENRYGDNGKFSYADVFTHKYDSRGNWYERHQINYESETKQTPDWLVVYRVISYYEK
jgi:hypothetical protein